MLIIGLKILLSKLVKSLFLAIFIIPDQKTIIPDVKIRKSILFLVPVKIASQVESILPVKKLQTMLKITMKAHK